MSPFSGTSAAVLVFTVALALYLRTMHPSLGDGDSPEFAFKSVVMAVPHPPGYPLLLLLSRVATLAAEHTLPPGRYSVFQVQNALACTLSAGAVALVFAACRMSGSTVGASLGAAFLFGFAPHLKTYATQLEVFPLNNFLMALLVVCALKFDDAAGRGNQTSMRRWLCVGALVSGLGMSNQHTSIFFILPTVCWVVLRWPAALRHSISVAGCIVVGLSPYLLLPWCMWYSPRFAFASWGRTDTLQGLVDHFLRKDYGTFSLLPAPPGQERPSWDVTLHHYLRDVQLHTLGYLWICGVLAVSVFFFASPTANRKVPSTSLWCLVLVMYVAYTAGMISLAKIDVSQPIHDEVLSRFWFQSLLPVAIFVARGITSLERALKRWTALSFIGILLGVGVAVCQVHLHWEDHSDDFALEHTYRLMVSALPRDAVLIAQGDGPLWGTSAVAYGLGDRHDVIVVHDSWQYTSYFAHNLEVSTGMRLPSPCTLKEMLDVIIHKSGRRVFFAGFHNALRDQSISQDYVLVHYGVLMEFIPESRFGQIREVALGDPVANALDDWKPKAKVMQPYLDDLFRGLPIEIDASLKRNYTSREWPHEEMLNLKAQLVGVSSQLLELASYDNPQERDVSVPDEVADLVAANRTGFLWSTASLREQLPYRYRMLLMARLMLQHNRELLQNERSAMRTLQDEVAMLQVLQQLLRFHMCHGPRGRQVVHADLLQEFSGLLGDVLTVAATSGVPESEEFPKSYLLQYHSWLKRYGTKPHPSCPKVA